MLIVDHLEKSFPPDRPAGVSTRVLRDLSLSVNDGEFVCIIGPSGCGKSTLLKIVAGLTAPDSGAVHLSSALISNKTNISMIFQNGALLPWRTAEQNVALGFAAEEKRSGGSGKPTPKKFLAMVGLSAFAEKYPHELSGGQRQRVGIARALAANPALLLLDEPFSALDPKTTHELHEDILRVWKEEKLTALMVSHSIEEAVSLANRIVLMKDGAIVETFKVSLPHPRREQGMPFHDLVQKVRAKFFE